MRRIIIMCCAHFAMMTVAFAEAKTKANSEHSHQIAGIATDKNEARARRAVMADVKSWAIQLRFLNRTSLSAAPVDLIVIDHAPHPEKDVEIPFTREEIAPLKLKPDGRRRIVLAYLSVGEAERYRYYWKPAWDVTGTRPQWLGPENQKWPGDFQVRFADPDWQAIIFGAQVSYLDSIIAAGFDGVFLDRVDAFQDVEETMPGAEDAMIGFVQRLSDHARRLNPKFLVVMQNAEELANSKSLLSHIDGLSKEDLQFGFDDGDAPNPPQMVSDSIAYLRKAKRSGVKVLVLEYAATPERIATAQALSRREGFLLHTTVRMLDTLSVDDETVPEAGTAPTSSPQ